MMSSPETPPEYQVNSQIPIDLFVSRNHKNLTCAGGGGSDAGAGIRFADSSGKLVFRLERRSHKSAHRQVTVVDDSGNPLVYIRRRNQIGTWIGFTGDDDEEKSLIFKVERTKNAFTRTEFEIHLVGETEESTSDFKMKGSPFHRSCTIYSRDSIVAQTSLMYKLGIQNAFVLRHRFRLTIFPGRVNHSLIVALISIFFDGRKLWI